MTPQLRNAIENIVEHYFRPAKKSWDSHAFNKKPHGHPFKSLQLLRDSLKVNRQIPRYTLLCAGDHEIHFLVNAMSDLTDSLSLSPEQLQWTNDLYNKILVFCLHEHPRTTAQKELKEQMDNNKALEISLNDGKQMILARIRNMLLTQNI